MGFRFRRGPALLDVVKNGKRIPAVAHIGKMGLMFIFDRTNGAPIFGLEERRCRQATCRAKSIRPRSRFR